MPARTSPSAKPSRDRGGAHSRFTEEERAAMRDRVRDTEGEEAVLAKIAEMPAQDRAMAERLHALLKTYAPELTPRTWYGMPAYAKDGKVLCYFQSGARFKARYATLGFGDRARLDEGTMWPVVYALTDLGDAEAERIVALVRRAIDSP
ncbi:MAG: DUF1801 domain-containing protein [Firmicutes bacterium]|nr:DUF1801 domain-containing protein [Bacillota bacterium]